MSSQGGEPTTLPSLKREDQVLCPLRSTDTQLPVFDWALFILMVRSALWPCQCHLASSLWLGLCGLGLTRPLLGSVLGLFFGSASVGLGLWLARPLLGSALCPVHAARPWLARPLLSCCGPRLAPLLLACAFLLLTSAGSSVVGLCFLAVGLGWLLCCWLGC